jgi:hypothetical protein
MKWSRDHVLTCSYVRDLDCRVLYRQNVIIDRLILLLVQVMLLGVGCSQLSTFSLAYSISWTLPHPESAQDDDPAIYSSGVIALLCFRFLPPGGQAKNQTELKFGV